VLLACVLALITSNSLKVVRYPQIVKLVACATTMSILHCVTMHVGDHFCTALGQRITMLVMRTAILTDRFRWWSSSEQNLTIGTTSESLSKQQHE